MDTLIVPIAGGLIGVLLLAILVPIFRSFRKELRYIEMKILNSRHEKEQAYWENRKKRLWKSLLPFRHYDPHHHHEDK